MLKIVVAEPDHCRQIENLLHNLMPAASFSYVRKLASSGNVSVNGLPSAPGVVLTIGDTIAIKESGKAKSLIKSRRPELDILYEDSAMIIFNKPPGLPMHLAAEVDDRNLVDMGTRFLIRRDGGNGKLRPVNRLDRGTSGAVILAKSSTSAGILGRQVKEIGIQKLYLALVDGKLSGENTINVPLDGKDAETRYVVLASGPGHSLVAVYPVTGRMHQIRLHFEAIGHPICGDRRYGGAPAPGIPGHALHSFRSSIVNPATGEQLTVFAPLPSGFLAMTKDMAPQKFEGILKALPDLP